ncbi:MAG: NADPH-dependent F420 reductase [Steroidobacteraceae bacterium]
MRPVAFVRTVNRRALPALAAAVLFGATGLLPGSAAHAHSAATPLRIGIIGSGRIGGTLARYWAKAGNDVFVSSRHPEELKGLVAELGPRAHAGTPRQAAAFGSIILVSVPYSAMPQLGKDLRAELAGKVIIDTSNPVETRDGVMALAAQKKGAGVATAQYLHDRRVVRAFNCISATSLASDGNRRPERLAIPIGGDDPAALKVAEKLVREAGFDPVVVGSLARTRQFDLGQPLATGSLTAAELRSRLGSSQ